MRGFDLVSAAAMVLVASAVSIAPSPTHDGWTTSWASAQQIPDDQNALAPAHLTDATLRQIVHLSRGGNSVRVRFSNLFGNAPLTIDAARIGIAVAPGRHFVVPGSSVALHFSGAPTVTIAPGSETLSDPVNRRIAPGADLAISIHLPESPPVQTGHAASRATSFVIAGNHVADDELPGATSFKHWFQLSGVEVGGEGPVVVTVGDSITDGYGSGDDQNARWPDILARRLSADPALARWGVANAGISGNRVLADGLGPRLIDRFERDVLGQRGVQVAILLEGVNDLGVMTRDADQPAAVHRAMVKAIKRAFADLARIARARKVRLIGGTITPFVGSEYYHPGPATEADRQAINTFIRTSGTFDAVIDFDAALRDPDRPDHLLAAYDSGDHLHPSPAGYQRMAAAVPLDLFAPPGLPGEPPITLTADALPARGALPTGENRLARAGGVIAAIARPQGEARRRTPSRFSARQPSMASSSLPLVSTMNR